MDYAVRFNFLLMGNFQVNGDYAFQDFVREPKPKLAFSIAYDFNNKPSLQKGQSGGNMIPELQRQNVHTIFTDVLLKYKGITLSSGYIYRKADDINLYLAGQSLYIVISYLIKKNTQVGIRFNRSFSGKFGNISAVNEYSFEFAYYILNIAFKLQSDYTLSQNYTNNVLSGLWRFRCNLHSK